MLGLLIRLVPAALTAHPTDMQSWRTIGSAILNGQNPYTLPAYGLVYPPLWGSVCTIVYAFYAPTQNPFVFNFLIKIPIIAADIAVAGTIEIIVLTLTKNRGTARRAMMLYLFNPATIILSSFWGMFDALPALLVLLSMILLERKQYLGSSLALGVGIAFKGFYPALLLPLFMYTIVRTGREFKKAFGYLALSILPLAITSIPFVAADAASFVNMTVTHFTQRPISNLTYWFPIHLVFKQNENMISTMAFVIFATAFPAIYTYALKKAGSTTITKTMTQITLAFYLTTPTVNEQYIVWLLPPMIIYAATEKPKMKTYLYALTAIVTIYLMANTGTAFFLPINSQLEQYQHLWPVMLTCSLIFPVVSTATLRKAMKENEREAGTGKDFKFVASEVQQKPRQDYEHSYRRFFQNTLPQAVYNSIRTFSCVRAKASMLLSGVVKGKKK
jgi:Gpi18-like mannosyltransferase